MKRDRSWAANLWYCTVVIAAVGVVRKSSGNGFCHKSLLCSCDASDRTGWEELNENSDPIWENETHHGYVSHDRTFSAAIDMSNGWLSLSVVMAYRFPHLIFEQRQSKWHTRDHFITVHYYLIYAHYESSRPFSGNEQNRPGELENLKFSVGS